MTGCNEEEVEKGVEGQERACLCCCNVPGGRVQCGDLIDLY